MSAEQARVVPLVAALFVQPNGCYARPDIDAWHEGRDARAYAGPLPVVAHPPCHLWVNLAALNFKRYGGEHNRPENDGGSFESALNSVRKFGGVLEHPAFTRAWQKFGIVAPSGAGWKQTAPSEWVCEVWQSAYGHKARKRTWLFYSGSAAPMELRWARPTGSHQCGWFDRIKPTLSKRDANATPEEFRDELIRLAINSKHP